MGPALNTEPLETTNGSKPLPSQQSSSKRKQKPFLSKSSKRHSSHNLHNSPTTDASHGPEVASYDVLAGPRNEDLEKKVDNLTAKIAELTALVMAQQNNSSEEL